MSADRGLVLFRVDAGRIAGVSLGHAFRSMALARELEELGFRSLFLMGEDESGPDIVAARGFEVRVLPREAPLSHWHDAALAIAPRVTVVDLLSPDAETLAAFRLSGSPLVVLDDLGGFPADCALVVNGSAVPENRRHGAGPARLLYGPRYMILGSEFRDREAPLIRSHAGEVLVTLGGSDPADLSGVVLDAAAEVLGKERLTFIAGPAFASGPGGKDRLSFMKTRFRVQENVPDLSMRMMSADLVITAGGRSAYELAALGVPALVVPTNAHETRTARALEREGTCLAVSSFEAETTRREIGPLLGRLEDQNRRQAMSRAGRSLVDGRGGQRVAAEILELTR